MFVLWPELRGVAPNPTAAAERVAGLTHEGLLLLLLQPPPLFIDDDAPGLYSFKAQSDIYGCEYNIHYIISIS